MAAVLIFFIDFINVVYSNDPERTTSANRRRLRNRIPGEFFPVERIGAKKKTHTLSQYDTDADFVLPTLTDETDLQVNRCPPRWPHVPPGLVLALLRRRPGQTTLTNYFLCFCFQPEAAPAVSHGEESRGEERRGAD